MAKVNYSLLVSDITGKLGGSVFQQSFGGSQIRTRVSPNNPRSVYQQGKRGKFGFTSGSWRDLTPLQRQSFIDAAVTPSEALNLYIATNINLSLAGLPPVSTFTPSATPPQMEINISFLTQNIFEIQATGLTTIVPAANTLVVYATNANAATINFFNQSAYSPVATFGQGTDLSAPVNIISDWSDRFANMPASCRISIKSILINNLSGIRGPEFISTSNTTLI